jgi:prepilin-type N-terminal cleavage/methylation domain-containing protein
MVAQNQSTGRPSQAGFTLLEMSIAIAIAGVLLSGALIGLSQYIKGEKITQTNTNIALVQNALSAYVQAHYRLPCPADPSVTGANAGTEVDAGKCFIATSSSTSNSGLYWETEGVLPWKELGISQDVAMDGWHHYITYKPAPQLTVNTMDATMEDTAENDSANDTQNACRTAMWYDPSGNHLNRAKALFCCNAAPKTAYQTAYGIGGLSTDWTRNGVVDTATAKTTPASGNSLPATTYVAQTSNWMDQATNSYATSHGAFFGFNSSEPEPPLLRATGLAVTLISHGGNGDLSFLPEQAKTALFGGGTVTVGTGVTSSDAAVENYNVWPPHLFAGVFGHPKVSDGSYNVLNSSSTSSDDIVSYLRSDDLFGRVGQGSCERPPAAAFHPEVPCAPLNMTMNNGSFTSRTGASITQQTIAITENAEEGIPYILRTNAKRLTDDAGYNNTLGVYTLDANGNITGVQIVQNNMHAIATNGSAAANSSLSSNTASVGTFIIPNGYNVNNSYANVDMTSLQMVYNYDASKPFNAQTPANVTDTAGTDTMIAKSTVDGSTIILHGANNDGSGGYDPGSPGNGIYSQYAGMNYQDVTHSARTTDINPKSVMQDPGVQPDSAGDPTLLNVGFEDLSGISGYYTQDGSLLPTKPPVVPAGTDMSNDVLGLLNQKLYAKYAKQDANGGYYAYIGDNDYDDVAVTMSMTQCPTQN